MEFNQGFNQSCLWNESPDTNSEIIRLKSIQVGEPVHVLGRRLAQRGLRGSAPLPYLVPMHLFHLAVLSCIFSNKSIILSIVLSCILTVVPANYQT